MDAGLMDERVQVNPRWHPYENRAESNDSNSPREYRSFWVVVNDDAKYGLVIPCGPASAFQVNLTSVMHYIVRKYRP
jgi:hypothetical protein